MVIERDSIVAVTAEAPINIALIKYWGKQPGLEHLNVPVNSSISICLVNDDDDDGNDDNDGNDKNGKNGKNENGKGEIRLKTRTTVTLRGKDDTLLMNGSTCKIGGRMKRVLTYIRTIYKSLGPVQVETVNFFPTAAGLASSASGFAALSRALATLLEIKDEKLVATMARLGSGSACRSAPKEGGFVLWVAGGLQKEGTDSLPRVLYDAQHWPKLRCLVALVRDGFGETKEVPSAEGMKRSQQTASHLLDLRLAKLPAKICRLQEAIAQHNFSTLAEITMAESDELHAICAASQPPIHYLSSSSQAIIAAIRDLNKQSNDMKAAYTFDAGPHAFIFFLQNDRHLVEECLQRAVPTIKLVACRVGTGSCPTAIQRE